jgi:hypothetical protein
VSQTLGPVVPLLRSPRPPVAAAAVLKNNAVVYCVNAKKRHCYKAAEAGSAAVCACSSPLICFFRTCFSQLPQVGLHLLQIRRRGVLELRLQFNRRKKGLSAARQIPLLFHRTDAVVS